jgi:DNA-binding HxlR family transcriptional regulator
MSSCEGGLFFTFERKRLRMYERKIPELLDCGLAVAIKVIGGKWKAWIIDCIRREIRRPSGIHKEMHEVAPRIINLHLKELEDHGIIFKKIYAEIPARVEYWFTDVGSSILPVIDVLEKWGNDNKEYINRSHENYQSETCVFKRETA